MNSFLEFDAPTNIASDNEKRECLSEKRGRQGAKSERENDLYDTKQWSTPKETLNMKIVANGWKISTEKWNDSNKCDILPIKELENRKCREQFNPRKSRLKQPIIYKQNK